MNSPSQPVSEDREAVGLLPCPFCGSRNVSQSLGEKGDGSPWPYIECEDCAATTEVGVWNRRAFAAPLPAGQGNQEDQGGWQPIETAPKGDDNVIVAGEGDWVGEARYHHEECGWWQAGSAPTDYWDGHIYRPTHWMPLPPPPSAPVSPGEESTNTVGEGG